MYTKIKNGGRGRGGGAGQEEQRRAEHLVVRGRVEKEKKRKRGIRIRNKDKTKVVACMWWCVSCRVETKQQQSCFEPAIMLNNKKEGSAFSATSTTTRSSTPAVSSRQKRRTAAALALATKTTGSIGTECRWWMRLAEEWWGTMRCCQRSGCCIRCLFLNLMAVGSADYRTWVLVLITNWRVCGYRLCA